MTIEGQLEVIGVDDFTGGLARTDYFVTDALTRRAVRFSRLAPGQLSTLRTGATVRISGTLGTEAVEVSGADVTVLESGAGEAVAAATLRTVLAIRVNFTDSAVPCAESAIGELMFSGGQNINGWYQENSFGAMGFTGRTVDVSINASVTAATCDTTTWANAADVAAKAAGADPAQFQHRIYVMPNNIGACSWAGLGNLSCGASCRAWVKTCNIPDVYAHELGHNLGWHHASTDANNDGVIDSEYGDSSDLMGIGGIGYRHTNAPHKRQLGWVPAAKVSTARGTVRLAPVEVTPGATADAQLLTVAKADEPGVEYQVSYRRNLGSYSANLSGSYADRVSIHRMINGSNRTLLVTTLGDGATWSDAVNGVSITQVSHDAASATVSLTTLCVRNTPTVAFTGQPASQPGGSGAMTVTVANRDSAGCDSSTFALSSGVPSGWAGSLGSASLTIAAGASATSSLSVTSASDSTDGAYAISVTANDTQGSGSYLVDSTPPAAVTTLGATVNKTRVSLSWSIPSDGAGAGAATYQVLRGGVVIGTVSATSYVDSNVALGTWVYSVVAIDAAGNIAPAGNEVTVAVKRSGRR